MKVSTRTVLFMMGFIFLSHLSASALERPPKFKLHVINADSKFEAAGIIDVNRDGKPDIFCGGFWYEAPTWKKHFVRDVPEAGEYHYDFAAAPIDVDGDGWTDIINAAWHNKTLFWIRNPGKPNGKFEIIDIDKPGNMETAITADINGDGQLDVLPNIMTAAAWYEFKPDPAAPHGVKWIKHDLPKILAGHGIGYRHERQLGSPKAIRHRLYQDQPKTLPSRG